MSTREIIAELPRLTLNELHSVAKRIAELTASRAADGITGLHAERIAGRLVLTGSNVIRQAEVEHLLLEAIDSPRIPWDEANFDRIIESLH
ncbi:MAG: hypothetical protein ABIP85_12035 [Chthoniobacteraceae bacterium]